MIQGLILFSLFVPTIAVCDSAGPRRRESLWVTAGGWGSGEEAQEGEALLISRPKGTGGLIAGEKKFRVYSETSPPAPVCLES